MKFKKILPLVGSLSASTIIPFCVVSCKKETNKFYDEKYEEYVKQIKSAFAKITQDNIYKDDAELKNINSAVEKLADAKSPAAVKELEKVHKQIIDFFIKEAKKDTNIIKTNDADVIEKAKEAVKNSNIFLQVYTSPSKKYIGRSAFQVATLSDEFAKLLNVLNYKKVIDIVTVYENEFKGEKEEHAHGANAQVKDGKYSIIFQIGIPLLKAEKIGIPLASDEIITIEFEK
ncbi:hypothetical protein [Mycoplasmopsis primatum]|uniref:hypothetical protein n=1 Tax=Mycoplasmopsis primatum TaxID=55604 RepID=UPI000496D3A5|nr:hypothetical protein [Mycoplasmopsis primatum]